MPLQPQHLSFRRAVRWFYAWIAAFLVALLVPVWAEHLAESADLPNRVLSAVLGTAAWIPLVAVVIQTVRCGDEYQRQLHVTAGALAFCLYLLVLLPISWLVAARFIAAPPLQVVWVGCGLAWAVSVVVVKYRFERRP